VELALAVPMDQLRIPELVRAATLLGEHRMHVKVVAVFEPLGTDGTVTPLPVSELSRAMRQGSGSAPPLSPVLLEGRVVGGICLGDESMPYHPCSGEFPERGTALLIRQYPAVPPGSQGSAPVLLGSHQPDLRGWRRCMHRGTYMWRMSPQIGHLRLWSCPKSSPRHHFFRYDRQHPPALTLRPVKINGP
jgi:hypothetical protein